MLSDESGTDRTFIWDGENIRDEVSAADTLLAVYTLAPRGYGDVIAMRRSNATSFHHYDALGSTERLTDSSENALASYLYRAFGEQSVVSGSSANPFTWVGRLGYYRQPDTDNYWLRARVHQPGIGRFLSLDPLRQEVNRYLYVKNRPVVLRDPSGRMPNLITCQTEQPRWWSTDEHLNLDMYTEIWRMQCLWPERPGLAMVGDCRGVWYNPGEGKCWGLYVEVYGRHRLFWRPGLYRECLVSPAENWTGPSPYMGTGGRCRVWWDPGSPPTSQWGPGGGGPGGWGQQGAGGGWVGHPGQPGAGYYGMGGDDPGPYGGGGPGGWPGPGAIGGHAGGGYGGPGGTGGGGNGGGGGGAGGGYAGGSGGGAGGGGGGGDCSGSGCSGPSCCPAGDAATQRLARKTAKDITARLLKTTYDENDVACVMQALKLAQLTWNLPENVRQAIEQCKRDLIDWRNNPGDPDMNRLYCVDCCTAIMAAACGSTNHFAQVGCQNGCSHDQ